MPCPPEPRPPSVRGAPATPATPATPVTPATPAASAARLAARAARARRTAGGALLLVLFTGRAPEPAAAQSMADGDGAAALGVALRRLGTTKRVLMIAAHPDDENTALIAELALGDGADVAYLGLTRGEGGQNLIGPELQEALGLIRSEELLAARRLDGAHQFFTRAYDFGYSKSADETLRHWPRDTVLADVVEIVRRYRPDVVVSIFSGTIADGHGQHQAAGLLARDAFTAAADPGRFPEHATRGLAPHRPRYLFQAHWRPPPDPPLTVATGEFDPLFGRSRYQIAMRSRSRHRSQDQGQAEAPGPQRVGLTPLAGEFPIGAESLFAGLDTTLSQHARSAGADRELLRLVTEYEAVVSELHESFNPLHAGRLLEPLQRALELLHQIAAHPTMPLQHVLRQEIRDVSDALRIAGGFVIDAVADTPLPTAGESFDLTLTIWNGGRSRPLLRALRPLLPDGWSAAALDDTAAVTLLPGQVVQRRFRIAVPPSAPPTEPYFLRAPRAGSLYTWTVADSLRGVPFEPRAVHALAALELPIPIGVTGEATFMTVDKVHGELRQPLLVVEPASVTAEPHVTVMPAGDTASRSFAVSVRSASGSPLHGTLRLHTPDGWRARPREVPLALQRNGESRTVHFTVTPPADAADGALLRAEFVTPRGTFARGFSLVDYPHIRPHALYRDAAMRVVSFPVRIADHLHVGYIDGAGDDGATALRQIGAHVEQLDSQALADADLSRYDAIVAGSRAYEVRPDIIAHHERLLDYVRNGGTFIVQYNKYELVDGSFMPYPATMARPHDRVTDPAAPVTFLAPDHPLLTRPNRITAADFDGWVQERGLYFLHTFDERYTPLLAMADPGEQPLHGALVAARVGRGWYVYTGLALFRQLPEGVPGAYRLLANLASLGRVAPPH
jgi:LmbE family N-acetylglucosaminyl deacetylase